MAPRRLGPLQPPPPALLEQALPVTTHWATLVRLHRLDQNPDFWGRRGDNRFDAPAGEFGVLYAATDPHGAFIETFGDMERRTLTVKTLTARGWARIEPHRGLRLVDLSGPGLAQIGADERLCSGEHDVAQQWSCALWRHPIAVDGLYYRARHDPSRTSVALYDRAAAMVSVTPDGGLMDDRHLSRLAAILETYQFSLV